jgi:hypothetical protein
MCFKRREASLASGSCLPQGANSGDPAQPEGELRESKSKPRKAKWLSWAFNNFFESGLFKGLRPIQIKNSIPS